MRDLGHEYVSVHHVLLALAEQDGAAARILREHGATPENLRTAVVEAVGPHGVSDQNAEERFEALERFARRPHRARRAGQARPGDRPRRGDPPRHPGALRAARRTTRS